MLIIPSLCSLPSWRTLQRWLFLGLRWYRDISMDHGCLIFFVKMQSRSAAGPCVCVCVCVCVVFGHGPTKGNLKVYHIAKSKERNPVTLFLICLSMIEMSHLTVTLLMHWQMTFLKILPLLSAQMHSHLYVTKVKSTILTFHLKMLR